MFFLVSIFLLVLTGIGIYKMGISILILSPLILLVAVVALSSIYHFLEKYINLSDSTKFYLPSIIGVLFLVAEHSFYYLIGGLFIYMAFFNNNPQIEENTQMKVFICIIVGIVYLYATTSLIKNIKNNVKKGQTKKKKL